MSEWRWRLLKMDFQALAERLKDAPDSGPNGQLPLATLKDQHKALTVPKSTGIPPSRASSG